MKKQPITTKQWERDFKRVREQIIQWLPVHFESAMLRARLATQERLSRLRATKEQP